MTEIGKRIKEIRLKKGLSQEELAESSKVNLRTIQRIENNETKPREKTLQLIFNALEIEIIEREKKIIDKYLIWTLFLTLLIIAGTFLGWTRRFKMYLDGEKVYRTFTGWKEYGSSLPNWLLSISSIVLGLIVICHSLGLIKNKMKYIILQLLCLFFYLIHLFIWNRQSFELRPGLFIIVIVTILLVLAYRKKGRKSSR